MPLIDLPTGDLPRDRMELEAAAQSAKMEGLKASIGSFVALLQDGREDPEWLKSVARNLGVEASRVFKTEFNPRSTGVQALG